ncbi:hypothetical protein L1286_16685 [Pseudoalteromonas sp. SMS1]|uniref:hypothetical protein n=1 Tax=Pseudoalteromonas sp. SMS1 TaxID=2908894 RepID=UPI001F3584E5|nr:hypothetical protein [Pseudoalteromonas sp. SMS1]MCF2859121.1 hypothetical protein [Pseudoalteromonas sp. SMS1]
MIKALYLGIIYLLPVLLLPLWLTHFQGAWIVFYIPFGFFYAAYVWFKPTQNMTKYIVATPLVFMLSLLLCILIPIGYKYGLGAAIEFLPAVLIVAIPTGCVIGLTYVTIALLILKAFSKFNCELRG